MAVYTNVTEQEAIHFLQEYEIGTLVTLKGIAQGVENSNFLLITTTGKYILTLYEKRVKEQELPWYLELMAHLVENGISCPLPVNNKHGNALFILNDRPAAIVTFIEGKEIGQILPKHCFALGVAMAKLHQAGDGFCRSRENGVGPQSWSALLMNSAGHGHDALIEEIKPVLDEIIAGWPSVDINLPRGQIHADLFPDNVFFQHDQFSGFIDFYFACTDFLAYDLAIAFNAWCFTEDGVCITQRSEALLAGYQSIRPLSDEEKEYFIVFSMGAALRFLLTRLYDWIHTPSTALVTPKDPNPYLYRLRYYQAFKAITDGY